MRLPYRNKEARQFLHSLLSQVCKHHRGASNSCSSPVGVISLTLYTAIVVALKPEEDFKPKALETLHRSQRKGSFNHGGHGLSPRGASHHALGRKSHCRHLYT
ncbi:hypothetical protein Ancab_011259 [Ancistrocladus abbreviatus]